MSDKAKGTYTGISPNRVKLDLVGIIAAIPSSTSKKICIACPPRSMWPPPCYVGIGMNSYIADSEDMPQWRGDAYLLTNGYRFYVENARANAWLSMFPKSSPGKLCYVSVKPQSRVPISLLAIISYVLPVLVLLPGVIFGNIAEAVLLVSVVSAGLSGTAYTYMKEKPGWVGPRNEEDDMRLLVMIPGDKWYLISGRNRDIKTATAGSAVCEQTSYTYMLKWFFKIAAIAVSLSAANTCLMAQAGLAAAYVINTAVCEAMIIFKGAKSIVIKGVICSHTNSLTFVSKQDMLQHVETEGLGSDMPGWRKIFNLTV